MDHCGNITSMATNTICRCGYTRIAGYAVMIFHIMVSIICSVWSMAGGTFSHCLGNNGVNNFLAGTVMTGVAGAGTVGCHIVDSINLDCGGH